MIGKLGLLEEVLDLLWVVVVTLPADTLNLADLASASCCLNVLEVNLRILADVDDGTKVVIKTYDGAVNINLNVLSCVARTLEALE